MSGTSRIVGTLGSTALPLATETALAVVSPGSVQAVGYNLLVRAEVSVTGAASATTCTLQIRRGSTTAGTSVGSQAFQVPASAVTVPLVLSIVDANPAGAGSGYVVTGNAAGAGQTAAGSVIECQAVNPTF